MMVSIPLESGHIVSQKTRTVCRILKSFNPLRIGSYCIYMDFEEIEKKLVSIPLESGHIVLKTIR